MQIKTCPRCGNTFECRHDDDIRLCQCSSVHLSKGAQLHLALHYTNLCLCHDCLLSVAESFPLA
ncbi:MAG: cysteine-rich CWC family protein [Paludibacteraceae bacterium]|nr:cysteine-rich CWC family protein [Paludibacteraceae bacterium]